MKKLTALLLLLSLLAFPPCMAENDRVIASFYPVYLFTQNILDGTGIPVSCMTAPTTGCLHDYQLLTSDMRTLSSARAFVICGAGMEGFLDAVTAQLPNLPVIDSSTGIALIREGAEDEMEFNAHIWLAPQNAIIMVENIASALAELYPDHAEQIRQNADNYAARLAALDAELAQALEDLPRRDIVTFHAAFPYFAQAYGLHVAAVVTTEPDEPISPKALAEVIATVREYDNPPLFAEPLYTDAALSAVQAETGAPVYYLDPITSGDDAPDRYETAMRENAATLMQALRER